MKTEQTSNANQNAPTGLAGATGSAYWHIFHHMADNHGLTLLESELEDICQAVAKTRGDDSRRLNQLESHMQSGRDIHCYKSTERYKFKLADQYNYSVPYQPSLREAIDAKWPNDKLSHSRNEP